MSRLEAPDELELFARVHDLNRPLPKRTKKEIEPEKLVAAAPKSRTDANGLDVVAKFQEKAETDWRFTAERIITFGTQLCVWFCVAATIGLWFVIRFSGEHGWFSTVVLFGPRWLGILPLAFLVPLAAAVRPRLLLALVPLVPLAVFGIMDVNIPWPWQGGNPENPVAVNIVTCNTRGNQCEWNNLLTLLDTEEPNIVALQEVAPNRLASIPDSWQVAADKQLAIASRFPIREFRSWCNHDPRESWTPVVAIYALFDTPSGPIGVCNVHLLPPHDALSKLYEAEEEYADEDGELIAERNREREQESKALAAWIGKLPQVDIILGDFSMPVDDPIYRHWWSRYENAFSEVGLGFGWTTTATWHNVHFGTRTAHVLTTSQWAAVRCEVGPRLGTSRLPLIATLVLEDEL